MRHLLLTAATVTVLAACTSDTEAPTATLQRSAAGAHAGHGAANGKALTASQNQGVAKARNATARFHDRAAATAAGYTTQYPAGCATTNTAAGAQGFHFLNTELVDATVDLLNPELVMYEPRPDGSLQLVGVDYIVPLELSAEPPTLLGVPFMRNEPLGVWALHIWAWRPNPSGMFAAWNPSVSCEFADRVTL